VLVRVSFGGGGGFPFFFLGLRGEGGVVSVGRGGFLLFSGVVVVLVGRSVGGGVDSGLFLFFAAGGYCVLWGEVVVLFIFFLVFLWGVEGDGF